MAYRNDLDAAHARNAALEQRVAALERDKQRLEDTLAGKAEPPSLAVTPAPRRRGWIGGPLAVGALTALGGAWYGSTIGAILLAFGLLGIAAGVAAVMVSRLIVTVAPGEVQIIDGHRGRQFVRTGTRRLRMPLLEHATALPTRISPLELRVRTLARDATVEVAVRAEVGVDTSDAGLQDAADRFAGRPVAELARVASETLEGALREAVATCSHAELAANPVAVAAKIVDQVQPDLRKLGLGLGALAVTAVTVVDPA